MVNKKIEKLTAEQEALLPMVRDKWLASGLSTKPANRAEAERGVRLAYEAAKLEPPRFILWAQSPYAGAWMQAVAPGIIEHALRAAGVGDQVQAQVWEQVRDQVQDQVGVQVQAQVLARVGDRAQAQVQAQVLAQVGVQEQVGDRVQDQVQEQVWAREQVLEQALSQVGAQVWEQVGTQVLEQVRDQVQDHLLEQVGEQVGRQVLTQVQEQVWDQVEQAQIWEQVGDRVGEQVRDRLKDWSRATYWSYDVYWAAWFDAMKQLGVEGLGPWEGLSLVADNAFWMWTYRGFAVLSERPTVLKRDGQNRLHSKSGPAVAWPDGWGFHAWHGTRVADTGAQLAKGGA